MRALAQDGVAVVSVFAHRTHLLAVVSKEAFGAVLVTPRTVPASFTGDATTLRHLARLLALAVAAPPIVQVKKKTSRQKGGENRQYHPPPSIQTEYFSSKWSEMDFKV